MADDTPTSVGPTPGVRRSQSTVGSAMSGSVRDQASSARVAGSLSGAAAARLASERVEAGHAAAFQAETAFCTTQEQSLTAQAAAAAGRQSLTASSGTHPSPVARGANSLGGSAAAFVEVLMWVAPSTVVSTTGIVLHEVSALRELMPNDATPLQPPYSSSPSPPGSAATLVAPSHLLMSPCCRHLMLPHLRVANASPAPPETWST